MLSLKIREKNFETIKVCKIEGVSHLKKIPICFVFQQEHFFSPQDIEEGGGRKNTFHKDRKNGTSDCQNIRLSLSVLCWQSSAMKITCLAWRENTLLQTYFSGDN